MARKQVVEIHCDRCERVENRPMNQTDNLSFTSIEPVLKVSLGGKEMGFTDLCSPCLRTVTSHIEAAMKKIEGLSPDRKTEEDANGAKRKKDHDDPPSPPARGAHPR